jgi:hypothetical protein
MVCLGALVPLAGLAGEPVDTAHQPSVNEKGRQPFQKGVGVGTLNTPTAVFTVPAKKRLVIEFFSAEAFVSSGETVSRFFLSTHPAGSPLGLAEFTHFIGPSSHGPSFGQELFLASQPLRMYVKAGDELVANAVGDGTGGAFMSVSGYLQDVR